MLFLILFTPVAAEGWPGWGGPNGDFTVDLVEGLAMPVARVGHLIALKVLSRDDERRPQDLVDLRNLLKAAPPQEITLARESLELVLARGYNRSRDLISDLEQLLETQKS